MRRVIVAHEPGAGFWAGLLVDRLALQFGADAVVPLRPRRELHVEELAETLADATGLLTVSGPAESEVPAAAGATVHLLTSLAIRAELPVVAVEVLEERRRDDSAPAMAAADDVVGVTRLDFDLGELDAEADRLISVVARRLGDDGRIIPSIELGPTTVPAFVGLTAEHDAPEKVASWSSFEARYRAVVPRSMLWQAVHGWFANGGRDCYIVPIGRPFETTDAPASRPTIEDYIGTEQPPSGMRAIGSLRDVTTLVLPDVVAVASLDDGSIDLETWNAIQRAAIELAEVHGAMAVLDPPPGLSAEQVRYWRTDMAMHDSSHACLYFPWLLVDDVATGRTIEVPPSGHVVGSWATTERDRGVWRAAANRRLGAVADVAQSTTRKERFVLSAVGMNPIRSFGSGDVRPWGSQTLSSDPVFADLQACRLLQAIARACTAGLAWTQFEQNDVVTRSTARRCVQRFLVRLWRAGALVGDELSDAVVVRCDEATSPPGAPVRVEVGVACTVPGELVWLAFGGAAGPAGPGGG